jgi:hypothetical protein
VSEIGVIEREGVAGLRVSTAVVMDGHSVAEGPGAQRLAAVLG